MEKDDDRIYYYTSDYVLIEWLKSEKIWATRSVSSNDSMDTMYAIKHLKEFKKIYPQSCGNIDRAIHILEISKNFSMRVYKDIIKNSIDNHFDEFKRSIDKVEEVFKLVEADSEMKTKYIEKSEVLFLDTLFKLSPDEVVKYFDVNPSHFKEARDIVSNLSYPFIISFSYNEDNRFLWDSYTNNEGVCLEFSKNELSKYLLSMQFNNYNNTSFLEPMAIVDIKYDDEEQKNIIKEAIELTLRDDFKGDKAQFLSFIPSFCKNPYWKPENECRAIFLAKYFSDSMFKVKENYNLKYKNGYKTQDYIEISIPKFWNKDGKKESLLKSIRTGPMNSKKSLKKYIETGLDKVDNKDKILEYFNSIHIIPSSGEGVIRK